MATTVRNLDIVAPGTPPSEELRAHEQTYEGFSKLILFAVLHIILVLACMALGFVGHLPFLAVILGLGGTLALLVGFAISG
ncbi:aa3-type cytochrome c oxidase subunit IV [Reyranella sp.]|uniref:aa3-type cytochrome c oxidase subunit IV n=1 Tax=Reyranella sp. TaxID=1929291 RepID=UPI003D0B8457